MIYPDHQTATLLARHRQAGCERESVHRDLRESLVEGHPDQWWRRLRRLRLLWRAAGAPTPPPVQVMEDFPGLAGLATPTKEER